MSVGLGRVRHALGDGATEAQAKRVFELLHRAGLLDGTLQLVGVSEFAEMAGVTPGAVCQWVDLPEPLVTLKAGRIWDKRLVEQYLVKRGRM